MRISSDDTEPKEKDIAPPVSNFIIKAGLHHVFLRLTRISSVTVPEGATSSRLDHTKLPRLFLVTVPPEPPRGSGDAAFVVTRLIESKRKCARLL